LEGKRVKPLGRYEEDVTRGEELIFPRELKASRGMGKVLGVELRTVY